MKCVLILCNINLIIVYYCCILSFLSLILKVRTSFKSAFKIIPYFNYFFFVKQTVLRKGLRIRCISTVTVFMSWSTVPVRLTKPQDLQKVKTQTSSTPLTLGPHNGVILVGNMETFLVSILRIRLRRTLSWSLLKDMLLYDF